MIADLGFLRTDYVQSEIAGLRVVCAYAVLRNTAWAPTWRSAGSVKCIRPLAQKLDCNILGWENVDAMDIQHDLE